LPSSVSPLRQSPPTALPASMQKDEQLLATFTVLPGEAGMRLDLFLVHHLEDYSRSALLKLIQEGLVLVNGLTVKAGYRMREKELVDVFFPPSFPVSLVPQQVDFDVLFEDDDLLVIVKPPGLVVHPAAGHNSGTLVHGLLHHCSSLPGTEEQRPGIVHRLDKDTSGIMLIAKTDCALQRLTEDFRDRNVHKIYHAVLLRCPADETGRIVRAVGRHPVNRKKMAVRFDGRHAATRWQILERFTNGMCFVELDLETGRTHQIRVHMASLGCPVAGDELYGGHVRAGHGISVQRQLLHASSIAFRHPTGRRKMSFTAPLWQDMQDVLDRLRQSSTAR
jgi:23S rRNA pseudouridine1911/1915/1917 synthase